MKQIEVGNVTFNTPIDVHLTPSSCDDPVAALKEIIARAKETYGTDFDVLVFLGGSPDTSSWPNGLAFRNVVDILNDLLRNAFKHVAEFYQLRHTEDLSFWTFLEWKSELMLAILENLPIKMEHCPFCIATEVECDECEYAKVHGKCDERETSTYGTLTAFLDALRRLISDAYPSDEVPVREYVHHDVLGELRHHLLMHLGLEDLEESVAEIRAPLKSRLLSLMPYVFETFFSALETLHERACKDQTEDEFRESLRTFSIKVMGALDGVLVDLVTGVQS